MNPRQVFLESALLFCMVVFSSTSRAYAATDPCALLSPAQVNSVLGGNVGAGKALATTVCIWAEPRQSTGTTVKRVTLTLQKPQAFAYAKMPVNSKDITKTPVSGVGEDAVYGTTMGKFSVLTVKKGDVVFSVRVDGFPLDQAEQKEKTLAQQVVAKL
jgi:hypothetical protein